MLLYCKIWCQITFFKLTSYKVKDLISFTKNKTRKMKLNYIYNENLHDATILKKYKHYPQLIN
jgi:hypothetical protein